MGFHGFSLMFIDFCWYGKYDAYMCGLGGAGKRKCLKASRTPLASFFFAGKRRPRGAREK
jgi:hypothetical protein